MMRETHRTVEAKRALAAEPDGSRLREVLERAIAAGTAAVEALGEVDQVRHILSQPNLVTTALDPIDSEISRSAPLVVKCPHCGIQLPVTIEESLAWTNRPVPPAAARADRDAALTDEGRAAGGSSSCGLIGPHGCGVSPEFGRAFAGCYLSAVRPTVVDAYRQACKVVDAAPSLAAVRKWVSRLPAKVVTVFRCA